VSSGTTSPSSARRSVSSTPVPPELVTIPTRGPAGTGCQSRALAASTISRPLRATTTPACRKAASQTLALPARAAVWEVAARAPASLRPVLATMIGLRGVMARARS
jgi:hypothetical protein